MDKERFLLLGLPSSLSPLSSPKPVLGHSLCRLSFDLSQLSPAVGAACSNERLQGDNPWKESRELLCRAGKPRTDSSQEGTDIPAPVKWIQGQALERGSKFSSGEQAQLKANPIFRPLSEGQALQQGPARLFLGKHRLSGFSITS